MSQESRLNPVWVKRLLRGTIFKFSCLAVAATLACSCKLGTRIPSGSGPEDLVVVPAGTNGRCSIVTATARRSLFFPGKDGRLEIYSSGSDGGFIELPVTNRMPRPFYPAGVAYVGRSADKKWKGRSLLYVCNSAGGSVEVFQLKAHFASHLGSLGSGLHPNGIAVSPDGRVFVSSMSKFRTYQDEPRVVVGSLKTGIMNSIAMYSPGRSGGIAGSWHTVIEGIDGGNGLALGPAGNSLLFCSYYSGTVHSVPLSSTNGFPLAVTPRPVVKVGFNADNLKEMSDGRYTLCGQRSFFLAFIHFLTHIPCSSGGMVVLRHDGKGWIAIDHSEWLKGHDCSPSTVILQNAMLYAGQPVTDGVFFRTVSPNN